MPPTIFAEASIVDGCQDPKNTSKILTSLTQISNGEICTDSKNSCYFKKQLKLVQLDMNG